MGVINLGYRFVYHMRDAQRDIENEPQFEVKLFLSKFMTPTFFIYKNLNKIKLL